MQQFLKESIPIIRSLYFLIVVVLFFSAVLSSWLMCSIAYSQETEAEESDETEESVENGRSNLDDSEDSSPFDVVIPENAAWSQTIKERFDASNITIPQDAEVRWTNEDELDHTITSRNLSGRGLDGIYDGRFYSGTLKSGGSFTYTFTDPGIYSYFCSPHPWMNGFVIVEPDNDLAQGAEETSDEDTQDGNGDNDNDGDGDDEDEDEDTNGEEDS